MFDIVAFGDCHCLEMIVSLLTGKNVVVVSLPDRDAYRVPQQPWPTDRRGTDLAHRWP